MVDGVKRKALSTFEGQTSLLTCGMLCITKHNLYKSPRKANTDKLNNFNGLVSWTLFGEDYFPATRFAAEKSIPLNLSFTQALILTVNQKIKMMDLCYLVAFHFDDSIPAPVLGNIC